MALTFQNMRQESVVFMSQVTRLKLLLKAEAPDAAQLVRRIHCASETIIRKFFDTDSPMQLLGASDDAKAQVCSAWSALTNTYNKEAPIPGTETLFIGLFDGIFASVAKAHDRPLKVLRKWMAKSTKLAQKKLNSKNVVILGGGFAGASIAKHFDGRAGYTVTLCDPKQYFEEITAMPKAVCNPGKSLDDKEACWPRTVLPYKDNVVKHGKVILGLAAAVNTDKKFVLVGSEKQVVPYDYLVISTGSSYPSNVKTKNATVQYRMKQMQLEFDALRKAQTVLVIGGGLVGVEYACEIAEKCPWTKVTIIQRNDRFLPRLPQPAAHEGCMKRFEELGVTALTQQEIVDFDEDIKSYTTAQGSVFTADKVECVCVRVCLCVSVRERERRLCLPTT